MDYEAAFLTAIRAAPNDAAPRLIYADWLEEGGDPRGELVRIEEEMRPLPVFSDRYWQLKPRRNELRARAAPDWLEAMHYGTDCRPLFGHGLPEGWKERWRLIREFVERRHRIPLADVGGRADEVREAEARLGRRLPPSLREWVAFAHDVRTSPHYHNVLRDGYQMRELDGHAAVSLLLQCEGDSHWAVRHADFALPDPPVYGFHWDFENRDENVFVPDENNPVDATVTSFALGYALGYTHAEGGGFGTDVADAGKLIRDLADTFPVQCRFGETEIFEAENILVLLSPSLWTAGRRIVVEVARPLPREAIPAFFWEYTRNGGSFHGMFTPDPVRGRLSDSFPRGASPEDDIPF
jgi:uncharacterized protein (TIGR02996 family)